MPEHITITYTHDDVMIMSVDAVKFYRETLVPDLRKQIAERDARIAELEAALKLATKWLDDSCDASGEYATDEGVAAMHQIVKALPPPPSQP